MKFIWRTGFIELVLLGKFTLRVGLIGQQVIAVFLQVGLYMEVVEMVIKINNNENENLILYIIDSSGIHCMQ